MPSLFSRSHQAPKKDRTPAVLVTNTGPDRRVLGLAKTWNGSSAVPNSSSVGEFGTVPQHNNSTSPSSYNTLPRTPDGVSHSESIASLQPTQYSFLTTQVPQGATQQLLADSSSTYADDTTRQYGFLAGIGRTVVLGLDEVARIIRDVGDELGRRALDTPLLFSNQSLEISQTRMKLLVQSFLATVRSGNRIPTKTSLQTFEQDIRFASDHELAWLFRWALSRMTRVREGTRELCHGCFEWDMYEEWRGRERAAKYPFDAFNQLQTILPPDVFNFIVQPLFSLLSRFAAHSHKSGLTPHAIASFFAALLFDIPSNQPCLAAHAAFVRAACATEHLLLSYIRSTGKRDDLGLSDLPSRLREWVKGYPSMVASDAELARGLPRKGARAVRCHVATRNVRAYSRDLIVTAETWAADMPHGWDTWDLVVLKTRRGEAGRPKFSTPWRRKMMVKETLPLPASSNSSKQPLTYGAPLRSNQPKEAQKDESDVGKYSSLAGQEWSAFEDMGFDMPKSAKYGEKENDERDIQQRLQFDLNESAKHSVAERRQTMDWSEFATGGFSRTENYLTASLTFSAPVQSSITEWPKERDELRRRLHKTQKEATPFNHDTTPRVGPSAGMEGADTKGRIFVEEAFVDCWADFMMGGGWTDREELTFKEASWALIEYKSRPERTDDMDAPHPSLDPRTTDLYFLFEERVPLDYQMAVADPKRKKSLHTIFKRKKEKAVPTTYDSRGMPNDFDRMLNRGIERKLTLSRNDQSVSSSLWQQLNDTSSKAGSMTTSPSTTSTVKPSKSLKGSKMASRETVKSPSTPKGLANSGSNRSPPKSAPTPQDEQGKLGNGRPGIFKKSIRRVKSGTEQREKAKKQREVSMDFEIQTASGLSSGANSPQDSFHQGSDEKWMDILIANGARPMNRDDHLQPSPPHAGANVTRQITPTSDITPTATAFGGLNLAAEPPAGTHPVLGSPMQLGRQGSGSSANGHVENDFQPASDYGHDYANGDANSQSSMYDDNSHRSSVLTADDNSVQPSDSISMRRRPRDSPPLPTSPTPEEVVPSPPSESNRNTAHLAYDEIVSPKPRMAAERDAIFSIVDHYGDRGVSQGTDSNNSDGAYDGITRDSGIEQAFASERVNSAYGGIERNSVIEDTYASERINSAYSVDDTFPPPPIFDLTPGREPSPARYKHGEPLHFVGEEEEEDEYN